MAAVAALAISACAARQPVRSSSSLIREGEPSLTMGEPIDVADELYQPRSAPPAAPIEVVPPVVSVPVAGNLEAADFALANAIALAEAAPNPSALRRVAALYQQHGVLDMAYDYLRDAEDLAPDDAATHDALARLWRDWDLPHLGLGAAYRATHTAPRSPQAYNTLGMMLQALGHQSEARRVFETGLALDPQAGYILNNLCYLSYLDGAFDTAKGQCQAALAIDPTLAAAHNNLALVYLATQNPEAAWAALQRGGPSWMALYNIGIAQLARGDYLSAAQAFAEASQARPHWAAPRHRATQALAHRPAAAEGR